MPTLPGLPRLAALGVLALVLALQINTASAGIGWCRADPGADRGKKPKFRKGQANH